MSPREIIGTLIETRERDVNPVIGSLSSGQESLKLAYQKLSAAHASLGGTRHLERSQHAVTVLRHALQAVQNAQANLHKLADEIAVLAREIG